MEGGEGGVSYVTVGGGRRIAYRELGCSKGSEERSVMVIHGLGSSRLAAMPGVSAEILTTFKVRMVAMDRPGSGRSDPNPSQTFRSFAIDLECMIDILELGQKIWLLGFSAGGAFCWAAARYIPHRISAIAMWCPVGCFWWKGISEEMRQEMTSGLTDSTQRLLSIGHKLPFFVLKLYVKLVVMRSVGVSWLESNRKKLSSPDQKYLQLQEAADLIVRDNLESVSWNKGFGIAQDIKLVSSTWEFDIEDVAQAFKGPIHIWQGDDDCLVPISLQRWIKQQVPRIELHELKGEGHLSWFCFNDVAHTETLKCLFRQYEERGPEVD